LFAKIVLADALLAPFVDSFYASPSQYGAFEAVFAIAAFSAQIFYDFSAYSTCAVGAAMCLGFVLPDNFRAPYAAIGFSDFWRRWHISLSTWLRDYVYIALGGNRAGKFRTTFNLMATMLMGGLWHGASWQFVIWGGIHGMFLVIERGLRSVFGGLRIMTGRLALIAMGTATFSCVSLAWVFFRAPDLASATEVFSDLSREGNANQVLGENMFFIFGLIVAMLLWHWTTRTSSLEEIIQRLDWRLRLLIAVAAFLTFAFVDMGNEHAFIYFQF
jgi:D-alanyl-lipoteichoic acid acyltransferase DltB (MBOAT superfamily)